MNQRTVTAVVCIWIVTAAIIVGCAHVWGPQHVGSSFALALFGMLCTTLLSVGLFAAAAEKAGRGSGQDSGTGSHSG